jgi:hypothetical protein
VPTKRKKSYLTNGVISGNPLISFVPSHTDLVLKSSPNLRRDHLKNLDFISKAHCILFKPKFPQSKPSQKRPNGGEFANFNGLLPYPLKESLSKALSKVYFSYL